LKIGIVLSENVSQERIKPGAKANFKDGNAILAGRDKF
jgi:hypothetical protein